MTITHMEKPVTNQPTPLMIVENNDLDVERVSRMLRRLDATNPLVHAIDGQHALDTLRGQEQNTLAQGPFGMLVDLNMPRMNGFELIEELRQDPTLNPTCIYIVTTSNQPEDRSRAMELGATGYLVKPIAAEDMANVLAQIGTPVTASPNIKPAPINDRFVMAIDDDSLTLERLRRNFVGTGWTFEDFTSPDLALRRLATQRPAVLLVDQRMPEADGLLLLQHLHQSGLLHGVHAVLMSEVAPPPPVLDALQSLGIAMMVKDEVCDKHALLSALADAARS